jgi:hypothetical protein
MLLEVLLEVIKKKTKVIMRGARVVGGRSHSDRREKHSLEHVEDFVGLYWQIANSEHFPCSFQSVSLHHLMEPHLHR